MKTLLLYAMLFMVAGNTVAQDFITRGRIEYEVKRNNKRIHSDEDRARSLWLANLPEFDISYRELVFSSNQLLYQPGRKASGITSYRNENSVFFNLDEGTSVKRINYFDEDYVYKDSVRAIKWKIENETRKIAGFECRKAVGVIYDSVYVVAFYCPEIIPQGGPECFNGLPGMILGLAIPRYFTTWFATRLELASIDESKIMPPTIKKNKSYNKKELGELLVKKGKETGRWTDATIDLLLRDLSSFTL
jgi:GLPGLI family protein